MCKSFIEGMKNGPIFKKLLVLQMGMILLLLSGVAFAQQKFETQDAVACGGITVIIILAIVVPIIISIAFLVWVAKDAKNRGMDSPVIWMIVVFFLNIFGLIIYLFVRPKGQIIQCPQCKNKKLQAITKCPHCGN